MEHGGEPAPPLCGFFSSSAQGSFCGRAMFLQPPPLNLTGSFPQRKLSAKSERVKAVDLHPREPWVLSALYDGKIFIWNYQTKVGGCLSKSKGVLPFTICVAGHCQAV
jgi:WD40 repeat protein